MNSHEQKQDITAEDKAQIVKLFSDAQTMHVRGNLDGAEKLYTRALEIDPKFSFARIARAVIWQIRGRIQDAVNEGRQALEDCEKPNVMLWSNFGVILKDAGLLEQAKKAYMNALALDPNNTAPKTNLAVLHMITGDTDAAAKLLHELSDDNPEDPVPWLNLARIAIGKKDFDYAEKCLAEVEDLDPKHPDLTILRAVLAEANHDIKTAVDYALKALERNPGKTEVWLVLEKCLQESDVQIDRLEDILKKLVTNKVQNPHLIKLAITLCQKYKIQSPLQDLEEYFKQLLNN